jgi:Na+-transporting methylmalonyl-CoA/oxaloacetate decarboxylase gamma subunit
MPILAIIAGLLKFLPTVMELLSKLVDMYREHQKANAQEEARKNEIEALADRDAQLRAIDAAIAAAVMQNAEGRAPDAVPTQQCPPAGGAAGLPAGGQGSPGVDTGRPDDNRKP